MLEILLKWPRDILFLGYLQQTQNATTYKEFVLEKHVTILSSLHSPTAADSLAIRCWLSPATCLYHSESYPPVGWTPDRHSQHFSCPKNKIYISLQIYNGYSQGPHC